MDSKDERTGGRLEWIRVRQERYEIRAGNAGFAFRGATVRRYHRGASIRRRLAARKIGYLNGPEYGMSNVLCNVAGA